MYVEVSWLGAPPEHVVPLWYECCQSMLLHVAVTGIKCNAMIRMLLKADEKDTKT